MITTIELKKDQITLIEKVGVSYESIGFTPTAARILALLLIADNNELTFDQIKNTLQYSKSATSNGINLLLKSNQIGYYTKLGDRKRYFKSLVTNWKNLIEDSLNNTLELNLLLKKILEIRSEKTVDFNNSLREVIDFLDYLNREMPKLIKKWELNNQTKKE